MLYIFDLFFVKGVVIRNEIQDHWGKFRFSEAETKDEVIQSFLLWVIPASYLPFGIYLIGRILMTKIKAFMDYWKNLPDV